MHTREDVEKWLRCQDEAPDPRQIEIWRRMPGYQKLALASDMYDFMHERYRA